MSRSFESWVFDVNFGCADLYKKHSSFMKIAYDARNEEIEQLEKELQETKAQLKQKDEEIDRAVEVINSYADTGLFCPNVFGSDADQQQCKCGRTHLVGGKKAREFLKSIEVKND